MNLRLPLFSIVLLSVAACGGGGGGAGGGGGGGGGTPITPPTPSLPASPQASGLVAAAAGSGTVRVDCVLPGTGFEAALFASTSAGTVYGGAPVQAPLTGASATVTGLADGNDTFFGLAIRATGTTAWTPVGSVLRTRPGAPIYVDAAASAAGANGQSPATAFPSLVDAMLVAGAASGGNVWVRAGDYGNGPFPLGPNVHVAGGFDATFTLAARSATGGGTRLVATSSQELVSVQTGGGDGTLDGLVVDGGTTILKGIDIVDGDVELRSLVVRRCSDRGVKAITTVSTTNRRLAVVGCTISENGSDGLSSAGAIDLQFDLSHFDANGQEGADIDDLQCPDNGTVSLTATGCRFFGNGFDGLDADLAAAPLATGTGTFTIRVENCRFEVNGFDGLLLDQEHEFFPGFFADITVRGCVARGNRLAGVHIDADARGTYALERLRCTANVTDGMQITSESNAGEVVLTSSWLAGNLGAGARVVSGNKVLLASHCGFAGNGNGGVRSDAQPAGVANSVFSRQQAPRTNASGAGNIDAESVFLNAPVAYAGISLAQQGTLTVNTTSGFTAGTAVVVGDDGNRLGVAQVATSTLVLDAAPQAFVAPGGIAAYASNDVTDDLRPAAASPARNAGIAPLGTTAPDAGPFGAASGGEPGLRAPFAASTLQLRSTSPSLAAGVGGTTPIVLTFDRAVDAATVTIDRVVVLRDGVASTVNLAVNGATVTIAPTTAWSGTVTVRLQGDLRGQDGSSLAAPFVAPIRVL